MNSSLAGNVAVVAQHLSMQPTQLKTRSLMPLRNLARLRSAIYSWCAFGLLLFAWDFADRLDHRVLEATSSSPAKIQFTAQNALMPVSSRPTVN